ncbi:MAG: bifunctional methylenetetrahydrofolate dehydrogenase/methenyltetrahydrofolate cyclohydrolase FolD [Bacteroidota bacterium]
MTAKIIDGKKIAQDIRSELKIKVQQLRDQGRNIPGLVAILVGSNPASQSYVASKDKACREVGMRSVVERLPENTPEHELLEMIDKYNKDNDFHGILVQLPLPKQIDENKVIEAIDPLKDVDGFHPISVGNLVIGTDTFYPCTPYGIVEMLKRYNIETKGKHVVVVGRSNIVGKPIANMLLQKKENANAIVTVCHSAARDLSKYTLSADILIAAIGSPEFIKADMISPGAVIIDVGINRVEDTSVPKGYRIVGDVDYLPVSEKASYITPVPGGVGALTPTMLLVNTYNSFIKSFNK